MPCRHLWRKKAKLIHSGKSKNSKAAARNRDHGGERIKPDGYFWDVEDLAEELQIVSTKGNHAATVAQKGNMPHRVKGEGQVEKRNIIAGNGDRIAVAVTRRNNAGKRWNWAGREKGTFQREF